MCSVLVLYLRHASQAEDPRPGRMWGLGLGTVRRSEEKQVEIEELRAEVRRGEQRLRTANRDMKSMQDKAELHAKFSTQYLAELEALRGMRSSPDKRGAAAPSSNRHKDASQQAAAEAGESASASHTHWGSAPAGDRHMNSLQ